MVMAVNNSPLLVGATDVSGLSDNFRDGLKLRQEYEARQQQKAMNDLMGIGDFNERLAAAGQHKYSGALVPMVQQYEEARQKAALGNLKDSAEIGKIYGETGKLGAETGKITAETDGENLKTATGVKDYISAAAVTQDPNAFGVSIGELFKRGIITADQTSNLLGMVQKAPAQAAAIMQRMAMGNPEIAKIFKPEYKETDGGDKKYGYSVNGFTGEAGSPSMEITKGESPDNLGTRTSSEENSKRTLAGTKYTADVGYQKQVYASDASLEGSKYNADVGYQKQVYASDSTANTAGLKLGQDGQIQWFNAETARIKANNPPATGTAGGRKPKPASILKMESEHIENLEQNKRTMQQNLTWMQKLQSGELTLSSRGNAMNTAANRTGISALGSNPTAFAEFNSFIMDLANKALRLNKGVQTDADYERQLKGMISGTYLPRDNKTAIALLSKINTDFATANKATYTNLKNIRGEYGQQMPAYGSGAKTPAKTGGNQTQALGDKHFK